MHRTQLNLEQWQIEILRARAEAEGRSMGAIVREILTAHLERDSNAAAESLDSISGIAEGPGDLGRNHDHYLYGLPRHDTEREA